MSLAKKCERLQIRLLLWSMNSINCFTIDHLVIELIWILESRLLLKFLHKKKSRTTIKIETLHEHILSKARAFNKHIYNKHKDCTFLMSSFWW